jgi:hypothetical protein
MKTGDLDAGLLHRIMVRLGELRETSSAWNPPCEGHLMELVQDCRTTGQAVLNYLQRHTDYLNERRLLKIVPGAPLYRVLQLTAKGQTYLQPELAEFGETPILPAVLKGLESKIAVLTYPEEEKEGMLHRLRDALAERAPDLLVKVLVEVGAKIAEGNH